MLGKLGFGATLAVSPPSFALGYTWELVVSLTIALLDVALHWSLQGWL